MYYIARMLSEDLIEGCLHRQLLDGLYSLLFVDFVHESICRNRFIVELRFDEASVAVGSFFAVVFYEVGCDRFLFCIFSVFLFLIFHSVENKYIIKIKKYQYNKIF